MPSIWVVPIFLVTVGSAVSAVVYTGITGPVKVVFGALFGFVYAPLVKIAFPDKNAFSSCCAAPLCGDADTADSFLLPTIVVSVKGTATILLHIGIDTVDMAGDGFTYLVSLGQQVKAGDALIRFDREKIRQAGHPDTTVCVVSAEKETPA